MADAPLAPERLAAIRARHASLLVLRDADGIQAEMYRLLDERAVLLSEVGRLGTLAHVPGEWQCPMCGYAESRRVLSALDGSVGVDATPALPCPSDGTAMRPLAWRDLAQFIREERDGAWATIAAVKLAIGSEWLAEIRRAAGLDGPGRGAAEVTPP